MFVRRELLCEMRITGNCQVLEVIRRDLLEPCSKFGVWIFPTGLLSVRLALQIRAAVIVVAGVFMLNEFSISGKQMPRYRLSSLDIAICSVASTAE